ncbi:3-isopropylmalate dehydratase small subunit [Veillonella sp. LMAG:2]|uniref:LeuD/DmdB family oxidoreductase small subunit n=1 Tax=Veillonella sp. LMAG:2 TaxID=1969164 RepID=UPI0025F347BC|nr:3-isopropylmalate dehydratase small subunit [Veillonella sp. LMAG:2]
MDNIIKGEVFTFGNNIDTDQIYPGRFVELTDLKDIVPHTMQGADPTFASTFKAGDIVVGGTNFGCGSSREHAAICLKGIGAGAVIAESFARIFYRNGINLGLPLVVCPGISKLDLNHKEISLDLEAGTLTADGKVVAQVEPFTPYVLSILEAGGIKNMIRAKLNA